MRVNKLLEQNIIDDIGVNFLFKRGSGLREGLIDINRAYRIIEKIDDTLKESQLREPEKPPEEVVQDMFDVNEITEEDNEKAYNFDFIKFFNHK
jgi:hypothetical protein